MMPSDTVCPRSGCATMSASAITAAGTSGISISRSDARSMRRAASRCAPQIANAILASSEGCIEKPGDHEPTARSVGFLADSRDQHQHQHARSVSANPENGEAAHQSHRHAHRDVEREQPDERPQHLLAEDRPTASRPRRRSARPDAESTMIRPSVVSSAATAMIEVKRRHRPAQPGAEPGRGAGVSVAAGFAG